MATRKGECRACHDHTVPVSMAGLCSECQRGYAALRQEVVDDRIAERAEQLATDFTDKYPHGVLTEQEGGVPNDAEDWIEAVHVCRKHKVREHYCIDSCENPDNYLPNPRDGDDH